MTPRDMAKAELDAAMLSLLRAFNAARLPDVPYSFPQETVEHVGQIVRQALRLFNESTISANVPGREGDASFQRFMAVFVKQGSNDEQ